MTAPAPAPAPGLARATDPGAWPATLGSAPGWPLVLYFHHVHPAIRHYTALTPAAFDRALAQLAEQFHPLAPEAVAQVKESTDGAPRCLVTLDDGYADIFEHGLPILERHAWRALFFVTLGTVGRIEHHPARGPLRHMSWEQLEELERRGHVIASHGYRHIAYDRLAREAVQTDLDKARALLTAHFPKAPDWFAYPYGARPAAAVRLPSLCFGTVKAPALPWDVAPHAIRRTYLSGDAPEGWQQCITEWRNACGSH